MWSRKPWILHVGFRVWGLGFRVSDNRGTLLGVRLREILLYFGDTKGVPLL